MSLNAVDSLDALLSDINKGQREYNFFVYNTEHIHLYIADTSGYYEMLLRSCPWCYQFFAVHFFLHGSRKQWLLGGHWDSVLQLGIH